MTILLGSLFLLGLIELLMAIVPSGKLKTSLAVVISVFTLSISFGLIVINLSAWTILICFFSIFRCLNLLRLIDGRKQVDFLRHSFVRSTQYLLGMQVIVLLFAYLSKVTGLSYSSKWTILVSLQFIAAVIIAFSLRRTLAKTRPVELDKYINERDLPSVSVAIPARNETTDLEACLSGLIKSVYPRLEILVLDDCSQDKRTPEIIRDFAQSGVRFLEGGLPPESWSAKNFAYQQLAEAASGKVILFCGVDARFETNTIRKMIELMIYKRKTMLSVIPRNSSSGLSPLKLLAIQPWRYFWELGLPRRKLNRPPVLSTCWLIDKASLLGGGGFKAVSRSILPERYFARETIKQSDGYSFIQSNDTIGLSCHKNFHNQYGTAIRTRYPALRQRLELVSLVSLSEVLIFVMPIIVFFIELDHRHWWLSGLSGLSFLLLSLSFYRVVGLAYRKRVLFSLIAMPMLAIYDISLLLRSMWQYEFNEVVWKGRNVCVPVMRIYSDLSVH